MYKITQIVKSRGHALILGLANKCKQIDQNLHVQRTSCIL